MYFLAFLIASPALDKSPLNSSTTYAVQVLAKDVDNNKSAKSATVNATTTDGSSNGVNELFISEYVEGPAQNNGIEVYNPTNATIDLAGYSTLVQSATTPDRN